MQPKRNSIKLKKIIAKKSVASKEDFERKLDRQKVYEQFYKAIDINEHPNNFSKEKQAWAKDILFRISGKLSKPIKK